MKTTQSFDAIGTFAAPATLTATASANSFSKKSEVYDSVAVRLKYTPNETNSYAKLYFLESDNGTDWHYRAARLVNTDVTDVYTSDSTGAVGIYERFPNEGVSVDARVYTSCYKIDLVGLKYFKVMASEATTGAFGTLYVGLTFINPKCR